MKSCNKHDNPYQERQYDRKVVRNTARVQRYLRKRDREPSRIDMDKIMQTFKKKI